MKIGQNTEPSKKVGSVQIIVQAKNLHVKRSVIESAANDLVTDGTGHLYCRSLTSAGCFGATMGISSILGRLASVYILQFLRFVSHSETSCKGS